MRFLESPGRTAVRDIFNDDDEPQSTQRTTRENTQTISERNQPVFSRANQSPPSPSQEEGDMELTQTAFRPDHSVLPSTNEPSQPPTQAEEGDMELTQTMELTQQTNVDSHPRPPPEEEEHTGRSFLTARTTNDDDDMMLTQEYTQQHARGSQNNHNINVNSTNNGLSDFPSSAPARRTPSPPPTQAPQSSSAPAVPPASSPPRQPSPPSPILSSSMLSPIQTQQHIPSNMLYSPVMHGSVASQDHNSMSDFADKYGR